MLFKGPHRIRKVLAIKYDICGRQDDLVGLDEITEV